MTKRSRPTLAESHTLPKLMWFTGHWETEGILRVSVEKTHVGLFRLTYATFHIASLVSRTPLCYCEAIGEEIFPTREAAVLAVLSQITHKLEALDRQKARLVALQERLT